MQKIEKILIAGCGAIGSNLAHNLAHDIKDIKMYVLDRDKVEARNVQAGTQFYFRNQVGMEKSKALQINVYQSSGWRIASITHEILDEVSNWDIICKYLGVNNKHLKDILIIDCLDNAKSRNTVSKFTSGNMHCLHVAFSPQFTYDIRWAAKDVVFDNTNKNIDICAMPGARSFIQYVSGVAGQVVHEFISTGKKNNFFGNRFIINKG
jgi:hypothetical protein